MAAFARDLAQAGHAITVLDIGGGIGVPYRPRDKAPDLTDFTRYVKTHLGGFDGEVFTEPGRILVGDAGILLTRIEFIKRTAHKTFVVLDAAMNDLMRPALYDAYHPIVPVREVGGPTMTCDIVGGICETSDLFAAGRSLPAGLVPGDYLAIAVAGAYGETMSNTYNARDLCAAVMVQDGTPRLARRRWGITEQMGLEAGG
jgi:diaminopimelate decarboxylase